MYSFEELVFDPGVVTVLVLTLCSLVMHGSGQNSALSWVVLVEAHHTSLKATDPLAHGFKGRPAEALYSDNNVQSKGNWQGRQRRRLFLPMQS